MSSDGPVRRQPPYPATLPPDLPIYPEPVPRSTTVRRRAANLAAALAGYAITLICLMGAAVSVAFVMTAPH